MCSNPFGIIEDQLLLQCSEVKCGVQYCNSCVQAIQGSSYECPFVCIACKKSVTPQRNMLLEKHIIWKSMCKLYGIQSMLDLKEDSNKMFCYSILKNIEFRRIHLQSRLNSFQNRLGKENSIRSTDEQLIIDVSNLILMLQNLVKQIKRTNQEMKDRGIILSNCLEKYKKGMKHFDRLCDTLTNTIETLEMNSNNVTTDTSIAHKEHIKELYRMDNLQKLPSDQNIVTIDEILEDIMFRKKCLSSRWEMVTSSLKNKPEQIRLLDDDLKKAKKKLEIISIVEEELNELRGSLQAIKDYTDEYDKLLRDDKFQHIPCSKFILLFEMMRVRTEELEISNSFPRTVQLMRTWQNDHGTDNEFKPKVINLFKTVEMDMQHLLIDYNWVCSLSYKIGVIGDGNVGKSALIMKLAEVKEFSPMIAIERSTFGYLEFDTLIYKYPCNDKVIPITFVDIEGATDTDKFQSTGNYIELINKTDCDMYIIVFDRPFSDHNRTCQEHIEKKLGRKCLLVWSKADLLFSKLFRQSTGEKYVKTRSSSYDVNMALTKTKDYIIQTFDDKRLSHKVYLTAVACDDDLEDATFAAFDLDKLKRKFVQLAITDFRAERICKLAILASRAVINTCFRREYTVSQTKYRWLAAGASIVPFLDELPVYFGRKKIRQAFGIHDSFAVTNVVHKTKDSFEKYLMKKEFTVPKKYLKSGYFKYLIPTKTKQATTDSKAQPDTYVQQKPIYTLENQNLTSQKAQIIIGHAANIIVRPSLTVLGTLGKLADDAARLIVPTTTFALRAVSIAGIVVRVYNYLNPCCLTKTRRHQKTTSLLQTVYNYLNTCRLKKTRRPLMTTRPVKIIFFCNFKFHCECNRIYYSKLQYSFIFYYDPT